MPSRRFLTILGILALVHVYVGCRLLPALPIPTGARVAGGILLTVSFVSMPLGFFARSFRNRVLGDRVAAFGLFMMGFFSSLFVFTLLRDVVLAPTVLLVSASQLPQTLSASAVLAAALALFATGVGFVNARRRAAIVKVDVPIKNLPPALEGFTIAQISDVHVGPTIKAPYVEAIVDAVNALQADLIAVTGDMVDGSVRDLAGHTAPLARLTARHGAYFVTGNHEYYSGEPAWTAEFKRLGLRVLMNEHVVLTHEGVRIVVAGVTDYSAHHFNPAQRSDPAVALANAPADAAARILLAHQPRSAPAAAAAGFDLQLSGHTHGGQFWPWNFFVRLQQPFTAGLHRLNDLWIYISRGTGYWGPPKRFGSPSEITHLRLVRAS
ncbi:MAG TPA: metallophosphoesterase [Steroidobacteraceae bacterium]|jgi:predicted MPP superfamily phosphohydrolase|nr:metallophosphoesterase [Steroidobacteraceae bacterium]